MLAKRFDHSRAISVMRQAMQRVEHRQVRLAPAAMLDALPASNPGRLAVRRLTQKRFENRGFTDARLSVEEDDLARAE
jgi:hypothetical protein